MFKIKCGPISWDEFSNIVFGFFDDGNLNGNKLSVKFMYPGNYEMDLHQQNFTKIMKDTHCLTYNIYKKVGYEQEFLDNHEMFYVDSGLNCSNVCDYNEVDDGRYIERGFNLVRTTAKCHLYQDPWFQGDPVFGGVGTAMDFNGYELLSNILFYIIPKKLYFTIDSLGITNESYIPRNWEGSYWLGANNFLNLRTFISSSDYKYHGDFYLSKCFSDKLYYYSSSENGTTYTDESGITRTCVNDITVYKTVFELKSITQSMKNDVDKYIEALSVIVNYSATEGYKSTITYNENDGFYLYPKMGKYLSYGKNYHDSDSIGWVHENKKDNIEIPDGVISSINSNWTIRPTAGKKDGWAGPHSSYYTYETFDNVAFSGGTIYSTVNGSSQSSKMGGNFGFTNGNGHSQIFVIKSGTNLTTYCYLLYAKSSQGISFGDVGGYYEFTNIEISYVDENSGNKYLLSNSIITGAAGSQITLSTIDGGYRYKPKSNGTGANFRFGFNVKGFSADTVPSGVRINIDFDTKFVRATLNIVEFSSYMVFSAHYGHMYDGNSVFKMDNDTGTIKLGRNYISDDDLNSE